ncbi:OLC1v1013832C1 [Oldenlandia corymbosa var. corymbosa]|uniref:CASP-like protein n=1 Tax=Oldenlandia corymbosa var. corymbosa TaxID=529605 RepID=A0AAV1DZ84_OLDCO|nr:OLC1v1013832C1 [Oldenlandia corymbosa var. corymbosa]
MASKTGLLYLVLVLRVFTLLFLAASIVVLATDKVHLDHDTKIYFTDVLAYRYVMAVAVIGLFYTLIQLPFAIYFVAKEKRWIQHGCLPEFDFYGDLVISFLLATGVGVGFGFTIDAKRALKGIFADAEQSADLNFDSRILDNYASKSYESLDRAMIATGMLLCGFVTMAITSIITSFRKTSNQGEG